MIARLAPVLGDRTVAHTPLDGELPGQPAAFGASSPQTSCKPRVTAAAVAVELVADGIGLVVVLVVILGGIELICLDDGRDDGLVEAARRRQFLFGAFRRLPLFLVLDEHRRAVLIAAVAELSAGIQRIDVAPEYLEQPVVADPGGIVDHLHGLGVAGRARRDLRVGGRRRVAADVAGRG